LFKLAEFAVHRPCDNQRIVFNEQASSDFFSEPIFMGTKLNTRNARGIDMKQELHVVLGASGIIGQAVVDELTLKKLKIRTVGRTKKTADADH